MPLSGNRALLPDMRREYMSTKNQAISIAILKQIASGVEAETAINSILGENAVKQIAYDIYDELQRRLSEEKLVCNK
jgi:hypothetical protein